MRYAQGWGNSSGLPSDDGDPGIFPTGPSRRLPEPGT